MLNNMPTNQIPKEIYNKLALLSLHDLLELTSALGIHFDGGNESVADNKNMTAKEQFLAVMDEVGLGELKATYKKLFKKTL